jgi:hypothetical protein
LFGNNGNEFGAKFIGEYREILPLSSYPEKVYMDQKIKSFVQFWKLHKFLSPEFIRFAKYLRNQLISHVILKMRKFIVKNIWRGVRVRSVVSRIDLLRMFMSLSSEPVRTLQM